MTGIQTCIGFVCAVFMAGITFIGLIYLTNYIVDRWENRAPRLAKGLYDYTDRWGYQRAILLNISTQLRNPGHRYKLMEGRLDVS